MKLRHLAAGCMVIALTAGLALGQRGVASAPAQFTVTSAPLFQAGLQVRTSELGGVYYPGEKVVLLHTVTAPDDKVSFTVLDADGKVCATRTGEGASSLKIIDAEKKAMYSLFELFDPRDPPALGYYTASVEIGANKAQVAFVVVPKPREDIKSEDSMMGMVVSPYTQAGHELDKFLHTAKRMGTHWASADVAMSMYAISADKLDFATNREGRGGRTMLNLDEVVKLATAEGMVVNHKLFGVPAWLASNATPECRSPWYADCYTSPIKDKEAYQKVVKALVERYKGKVRSYEFGNSPFRQDEGRASRYYCGTNEDFIRDLTWTSEAVKAADPTALVCAAGFVQKNDLVPALMKQAPSIIDVLTVHYITADAGEGKPPQWYFVAPPSWYDAIFKDAGVRKPMWDTSCIGTPADDLNIKPGATVYMNQINVGDEGIIRSVARNLSVGVVKTMLSALNIGGSHGDIYLPDGQPKSSVCEYAVAAHELDGAKYLQPVKTPAPLLEGYYFQRGDDTFAVVWSNVNGRGDMLELPAKGESCTVLDRFGRETKMPAAGGKLKLAVGFRPQIVHGLAP